MDDRELLGLAAKAAGEHVKFFNSAGDPVIGFPAFGPESCLVRIWNPLNDDGDALRLAVELGLSARRFGNLIEVCGAKACGAHGLILDEPIGDDGVLAAYRRGFTRAAAEIGRAM